MGLKDQALGEGTFDETTCLLLHKQGSGDNQRKDRSREKKLRETSKATGLTSKDASHDQAPLLSIGEVKGGPPLVLGPFNSICDNIFWRRLVSDERVREGYWTQGWR